MPRTQSWGDAATPPIRILIVHDSAVFRRALSNLLALDPEIAIVATAGDGVQALAQIADTRPDVVTLDIELRGMDGVETLVEIRKRYPRLPVIMFSTLTDHGAMATLDALERGASDYVTQPAGQSAELPPERMATELIRKIKSLCAARAPAPYFSLRLPLASLAPPLPPASPQTLARVNVVAIGASTGGPNALSSLIAQLPDDFAVPILIVQHMPPLFTRMLAERLDILGRLKVREGKDGAILQPGEAWIAPGDQHMTVARRGTEFVIGLNRGPQENSCRPAVDVLFRSVAEAYKANALAIVLTGMGTDGTRGSADIRRAGGQVIVQDEASSVVWGMPGSVVAAQASDHVYPLDRIGLEALRRVSMRRSFANAVLV
jgi:two-component system chemotaxis response regulator CheB